MKRLLPVLFLLFIFFSDKVFSQTSDKNDIPHFNHLTIYVVDMNKSADFYEKALMLKRIPEPFHDNRHIWMKIGEHNQLHIVQGAKNMTSHDINIHLAFSVPSVENFA